MRMGPRLAALRCARPIRRSWRLMSNVLRIADSYAHVQDSFFDTQTLPCVLGSNWLRMAQLQPQIIRLDSLGLCLEWKSAAPSLPPLCEFASELAKMLA